MAKNSFLLRDEWKSLFVDLPDESAGQLIKAAFCYHSGEDVHIDDPVLSAVFGMIKAMIDENDRKYEKRCEDNRKKIQKRWNTKEGNSVPNDTTVYRGIQQYSNDTDNDNDNDTKEKDIPKGISQKKGYPYKEIIEYLNQKAGKKYKPESKSSQKLIKARMDEGFTLDDFKVVIDNKTAQWKDDPKMCDYLQPSTLFAVNHFEDYLNHRGSPGKSSRIDEGHPDQRTEYMELDKVWEM